MRIDIDYVSFAIFAGAFLFAQIRAVPVKVRYSGVALACAAIAVYRLRSGAAGVNLVFVGLAAALAVYYVYRAISAGPRPG